MLAGLQRTAPRESQPASPRRSACSASTARRTSRYIVESLRFSIANIGFQVAAPVVGIGARARSRSSGRQDALAQLVDAGGSDAAIPVRAPIALALGTVALRNTPVMLKLLEQQPLREPAIELLREAFDMLEEDFEEERFFATVRRTYWQAPAGSPARTVADTLIQKLEF